MARRHSLPSGDGPYQTPASLSTAWTGPLLARSYADCRLIQNSGVVPNAEASSRAVSGVTPRLPRTREALTTIQPKTYCIPAADGPRFTDPRTASEPRSGERAGRATAMRRPDVTLCDVSRSLTSYALLCLTTGFLGLY
jgi:hypothetical protein